MDTQSTGQFSVLELFMHADIIVKFVMIGLAMTSVWSWTIAINKWLQVKKLENGAKFVETALSDVRGMDAIEAQAKNGDATAKIINIGNREISLTKKSNTINETTIGLLINRLEKMMNAQLSRELSKVEKGIGVLATIGSAATFIGLFGTVWGIMNSFRSIASSHDTNLAVVAPGIAEALFATAMGLVAAIPAVIFYNFISGQIDRYTTRVETLIDDFIARTSRRFGE